MTQIIRIAMISFILLLITVIKYGESNKLALTSAINNPPTPTLAPTPSILAETTKTIPTVKPTVKPVSLAETVVGHNQPADCWIIYSGQAYNITSYFGSHPGGDQLLAKYCGRDATVGFDTKEMAPGTPHSGAAKSILAGFLVKL